MRELTVNEQEAVNGGGWNWWEVAGGGFAIAAGATIEVPFVSAGLEILGGICDIIGAQN